MRIRTVTALVMLVCGSVASGGIEQLGVAAARPEVADAPIVGDPFAPLPMVTGPTGVTRRVLATTPDRSIAVYQEGMTVRAIRLDGGDSWLLSPVDNTVDPPNFVEISPDGQYVLVPRRSPDRLESVPILGGPATDVTGDLGVNGLNASNVTDVPGTGDLVFRRLTASMARSSWAGGTPQTVTPSLAPGRFIIAGARVSPEGTWLLYPTSGAGEQNRTLEAVNLTTLTPRTLLGTADLGLAGFVTGIVFPAGGQTVIYSAGLNGNRMRLYRQNLSSGPAMQSDDLPVGAGNVSQVPSRPTGCVSSSRSEWTRHSRASRSDRSRRQGSSRARSSRSREAELSTSTPSRSSRWAPIVSPTPSRCQVERWSSARVESTLLRSTR